MPPMQLMQMMGQQTMPAGPPDPEVEAFIATNPMEMHAASRLRALPKHQQRLVLDRGSLMGARDPPPC